MNQTTLGAAAHALTINQAAVKFQEASSRASCLASLARAAQVIDSGVGLYEAERSIVVADIIEAINFLAADLCKFSQAQGHAAERAAA